MIGIEALWNESDIVIKFTFFVLLIMSVMTWSVVFLKFNSLFCLRKIRDEAESLVNNIHSHESHQFLIDNIESKYFKMMLNFVFDSLKYYEANKDFLASGTSLSDWLEIRTQLVLRKIRAELGRKLSLLASIGSTAPFIGLFGTVWGIYLALVKIGEAGSASIAQVSVPVGEALTMTAIGLVVAIPAVLAFNLFSRANSKIMFELVNVAKEVELHMVASSSNGKSIAK